MSVYNDTIKRFPHDPLYAHEGRTGADGQPCDAGCAGEWPCSERLRQRRESKEIHRFLHSDLYDVIGHTRAGHTIWMSPLHWIVTLGYGVSGIEATLFGHDGNCFGATGDLTGFGVRSFIP